MIDFDPTVGSEVAKCRPALVVGVNGLGKLPLRIVVPITHWQNRYEAATWFTKLPATPRNGLSMTSGADAFQVKSVSLNRFRQLLGSVTPTQLKSTVEAIALCIGV